MGANRFVKIVYYYHDLFHFIKIKITLRTVEFIMLFV